MKKTKIAYWIVTILFAAFMLSTAIPDIMKSENSINMTSKGLGYPEYFIPFIGWAKLLGIIGILTPGLNRLKEWAYAGLCFDLIGATYSALSMGFDPMILIMILPISFLFISYFLWHKIKAARAKAATSASLL